MGSGVQIHPGKDPQRIHFIAEWMEHRGLRPADIVRELGVNKGTVSKWCSGDLPKEDNLRALAALLEVEPPDLFRDPHDDWFVQFFRHRSADQLKQMADILKAVFPNAAGAAPTPPAPPEKLGTGKIAAPKKRVTRRKSAR